MGKRPEHNVLEIGENLAAEVRRVAEAAPIAPTDTVVESLKSSEDKIKDRVATIVEQVTAATITQINGMRKQLDEFETLVIASGAASKASLEKHISIAAGTLASIEKMGQQIAEYSADVAESMPKNGGESAP